VPETDSKIENCTAVNGDPATRAQVEAEIVAWLRSLPLRSLLAGDPLDVANAIERGAHRKGRR